MVTKIELLSEQELLNSVAGGLDGQNRLVMFSRGNSKLHTINFHADNNPNIAVINE